MPVFEPAVGTAERFTLRHIGPKAALYPDGGGPLTPGVQVLSKTLVARPLPSSPLPTSPDLASGSWTGRLNDSGEAAVTFPNATASDGALWRSRFDPTGHLQFLEVYDNGELDFAGVIDQITAVDPTQVQVHCSDGWWLLKKAYERDWLTVKAPRDVIERGTQVWVPTLVDGFPAGALNAQWTQNLSSGGTVAIGHNGGCNLAVTSAFSSQAEIDGPAVTVPSGTNTWRARCEVQVVGLASVSDANGLFFRVVESGTSETRYLALEAGFATLNTKTAAFKAQVPSSSSYGLSIESDGEWISGYVNGQLIGCARRDTVSTTFLVPEVSLQSGPAATQGATATITGVLVETLQPFLLRSTDKGDYALPGNASTYPLGGLHARYFNDLDLQSDSTALAKILAPTRTQAYGSSSSTPEYMNQQDSAINAQNPPGFSQSAPGPGTAALACWSCKWFGSIWLKLSAGDYTLRLDCPVVPSAVRVWIGKTQFGDQILDQWTWTTGGSYTFTVSAAALKGTLPYGAGTQQRDGWYPIIVEFAVSGSAGTAPVLYLTNSPAAYNDPAGNPVPAGAQLNVFGPGSLSPLGCVDQRYQGVSHYDLVQQTGQAYDYQLSVEPKQLESGLFPGVLAPRWREGHDTDIILKPDRGPRQDGEAALNPSSGLDATDFASSMQGNGAGFQNGNTGQLQANVYDPPTLQASLFDAQGWQDFSDAAYVSLLQALLNSQLGLQLAPWELISADPVGSPRKAFTWPLPGTLANMRWRPGDGLRTQYPEINIFDTVPRQMLVTTRSFLPLGVSGVTATFAERPRTAARTLKRQLYTATRWQRNYQRQLVTLTGSYQTVTLAAGAQDTGYSALTLLPSDLVVSASLRVSANTGGASFSVLVNGSNVTSTLNGPWTGIPLNLSIKAVAAPSGNGNFYAQLSNNAGQPTSTFQYQLLAEVLR